VANRLHAGSKRTNIVRGLQLTGISSPAALAADLADDYAAGDAETLRIDGGAADRNINSIAGGFEGRVLVIMNIGTTNSLVVKNAGSGTAANKFIGINSADITIRKNGSATFIYDATSSRWRCVGSAA
jgi:hypothetical protein